MEVFEIDTANIRASIKRLETLKEKCSKLKKKAIKSGKKDSGKTHTQLDQEYKVMQDSWQQLITLIERTANYMQVLCDSNDESDTMCADKLKVNLYDCVGDRDFDHYCKDNSADIQYLRARGMTDADIRAQFDAGGKESLDGLKIHGTRTAGNGQTYYVINGADEFRDNQHNYNCYGTGNGNTGCAMTCIAVCRSIQSGNVVTPDSISRNSYAYWQQYGMAGGSNYVNNRFQVAYNEVLAGYPCIMYVESASGGPHYVVVNGVRSGADQNNLQWSDFSITEVGNGTIYYNAAEDGLIKAPENSGQIITMRAI